MTPPDLPPLMLLECTACGEPITVEQFAQSVERIETRPGGRQITSGPYHAECLAGYQPHHIDGLVQPPPRKP